MNFKSALRFVSLADCVIDGTLMPQHLLSISKRLMVIFDQSST